MPTLSSSPRITPFLWFDTQAEEAAKFYTSIFKNSKITATTRYGEAGKEYHQRPVGSVMTVGFELDGIPFTALNGGPLYKFNESVSFVVHCDTQQEIDHFWSKLTEGGDPKSQACGWLKDKYGLSWQIIPATLFKLISDPARSPRVMSALMQMTKLDIARLEKA
jgi:predicted 3-demethylubiquinone-9 3-methyltransferase (glyoxalase superfamily)